MDAEQSRWSLHTHIVDDDRTPVTALGHVARVAEAVLQLRPGSGHVLGTPSCARRLPGKSVARHRRDDDVERVFCLPTICGRIGEPPDELDLLEHGAWPAVTDDE